MGKGKPLDGDRSAKDVINYPGFHATDIEAGTLRRHLPEPGAAGGTVESDGTDWQRIDGNNRYVTRAHWLHNGFLDPAEVSLAWDDASRTLTVDAVGASFHYFHDGLLYTKTSAQTKQITDAEGLWLFYFDKDTLTAVHAPNRAAIDNVYLNECAVAYLQWDAANKDGRLLPDLHGYRLEPESHHLWHNNIRSIYQSGMALGDFVIDDTGADDEDAQFSVASGKFDDENIEVELGAVNKTAGLEIWYLDGSDWRWTTNAGFSILTTGTGRMAWNDAGGQTEVAVNKYALCHVFATSITDDAGANYKYIAIQGQATYATKALARAGAETEISSLAYGSLPLPEIIRVGTVIVQSGNFANAVKSRTVSTDAGDNYVDWRTSNPMAGGEIIDHTQFTLTDGTRPFTGDIGHSGFAADNLSITDIIEQRYGAATELTIAAGSVTRTQVVHTIDTQNDDAADDLDTIGGGTEGDLLVIAAAHTDRTVTLMHNTGNLFLRGEANIDMDDATTLYFFMYMADSKWHDLGGGGGGGGASAWTDLTDTPAAIEVNKFVVGNGAGDGLEFAEGAACDFETTTIELAGWEELERITLVGNQASIDFQNISQDYDDLKLVYRFRTDRVSTWDEVLLAYNADANNANYYWENLAGLDAVASAGEGAIRRIANSLGASATAGNFVFGEAIIYRYSETETHVAHARDSWLNTATQFGITLIALHWETAAAITRITLAPGTGPNFVAGSEVILYGLRKRDVVTGVTGQVTVDMTEGAVALMSTTTGIDATVEAQTALYTVPAGKDFIPDHVKIRVTAFTDGGKGTQAVASFGGNAATYDDYLNSVTYTIAAADVFIRDSVEDIAVVIQAAGDVFTIAIETASDATVEVWAVDVFGHLV